MKAKITVKLPEQICIGMVMHEDDDFLVLKVIKNEQKPITLGEAAEKDQFFSVVFVHQTPAGPKAWKPWEDR